MRLNKVENIRFINKGKQVTIKIRFNCMLYNVIPIYTGNISTRYCVIKTINDKYIVICKDDNIDSIGILDKLTRYALNTNDNKLIDIHLANWFGNSAVINWIDNNKSMECDVKDSRKTFIQNQSIYKYSVSIHGIQEIMKNLNFV